MKCYRVGGAVRDRLLGNTPKDSDWVVVETTPKRMIELGYQPVGRDFTVFLHPQSKEEHALARTERKIGPGYHGFHFHTDPQVTLEQDLKRRDLTINAMAEDDDGTLIDPYGGQRDLKKKCLRHVSPAFVEDPLRILRTARFAARLNFSVAPETLELMRTLSASGEIETLAPERVFQELRRALDEPHPQRFFEVLVDCNAMGVLFPELHFQPLPFQGLDGASSLAALLAADAGAAEGFCKRFRVPATWRHVATHTAYLWQALRHASPDAHGLLDLLKRADAFRRPEHFVRIQAALAAAGLTAAAGARLHCAYQAACSVNSAETAEFVGAARGLAIDRLRCARIEDALHQRPLPEQGS